MSEENDSKIYVNINYDDCVEDPLGMECEPPWELHTFRQSDSNYTNPMEHGWLDDAGAPATAKMGEMLRTGRAFIISHYEHGNRMWFLPGEGPTCEWDSVSIAGLLMPREPCPYMPYGYKKREELARALLKEYTNYINGDVYCFNIEDEDGNPVEGADEFTQGGYSTDNIEDLLKNIMYALPDGVDLTQVQIIGQCADLISVTDLCKPVLASS